MLPINKFTWIELARIYIVVFLSMNGHLSLQKLTLFLGIENNGDFQRQRHLLKTQGYHPLIRMSR